MNRWRHSFTVEQVPRSRIRDGRDRPGAGRAVSPCPGPWPSVQGVRRIGVMLVRRSVILILFLAFAAPALPQGAPGKDPGAAARKKLFRERFLDHFTLGVEAPLSWIEETRAQNGCRWDCSVCYLSGGAATGEKPFWLNYGNSPQRMVADCKKSGVVPWFAFYALAQSAPARYKPSPDKATPINAKVPATMKEYFTLFKTIVEGAGKEAPWPVMVHIEPDEWCHLLVSGGMDPAKVDVKIGS